MSDTSENDIYLRGKIMTEEEIFQKLSNAVITGKRDVAKEGAQEALDQGISAVDAINKGLVVGMSIIGEDYGAKKVYLPQVLMAAATMYAGLDILLPAVPVSEQGNKKKCGVAVVEGDVHDIGKNIVKTMMVAGGYDVVDLGKDIPMADVAKEVEAQKMDVIALSTLMSTTLDAMKGSITSIEESGYRSNCLICIGGPPTSDSFAEEIGADHRDANAQDCVNWLKENI